jgi:hypothetical protein
MKGNLAIILKGTKYLQNIRLMANVHKTAAFHRLLASADCKHKARKDLALFENRRRKKKEFL